MIWFIGWSDEYSTNWLVGKVGSLAGWRGWQGCFFVPAASFVPAGGGVSPGHKKTGSQATAGRFLEVSSGFEPLYKLLQSLA